jgi:hypothetical protein
MTGYDNVFLHAPVFMSSLSCSHWMPGRADRGMSYSMTMVYDGYGDVFHSMFPVLIELQPLEPGHAEKESMYVSCSFVCGPAALCWSRQKCMLPMEQLNLMLTSLKHRARHVAQSRALHCYL